MILFLLFFIAIAFLIAVFFYKQRRSDLSILQIESTNLESQLSELLEEQQPLVLRGVQPPKGLTRETLFKTPRLQNFPIGGQPLGLVLQDPTMLASSKGLPTLTYEGRTELAKELSIPTWAEQAWRTRFAETTWIGAAVGCMRTEVVIGGIGLTRSIAKYTCLFPTDGQYMVSILSRVSEPFLPPSWQYRYPSSFTVNDTAFVADLQYLDIVLRPGSALCIPTHILYSMEPADPKAFSSLVVLEYHEPISLLTKMMSVGAISLPSFRFQEDVEAAAGSQ
jgi:hypothetical protein